MPFEKLKLLEDKLKITKNDFDKKKLVEEYLQYGEEMLQFKQLSLPKLRVFIDKSITSCNEAIYILGDEEDELLTELEAILVQLNSALGRVAKLEAGIAGDL